MSQITKICIKRLQGDAKILAKHPVDDLEAYQDEKDMLIWYFLLKGPSDTHYEGGLYIGKIMHSPEYPFKAPDFMMLTPSGRFDIGKKICLTKKRKIIHSVKYIMPTVLISLQRQENNLTTRLQACCMCSQTYLPC